MVIGKKHNWILQNLICHLLKKFPGLFPEISIAICDIYTSEIIEKTIFLTFKEKNKNEEKIKFRRYI